MSLAIMLTTLNTYDARQSEVANRMSDILDEINISAGESADLAQETALKRNQVSNYADQNPVYADSRQYDSDLQEIEDDYNIHLAEINAWETKLNVEKASLQVEAQELSSYETSVKQLIGKKAEKDFTYGGSSGQ